MRQPVLYVAVCAVLMCGFQNPSGDRKNPPRRLTTGSERVKNRSLKDAPSTANEPAEVFDEPSRLSREMLVQKLATLQNEFNVQLQASLTQESLLHVMQLKQRILVTQIDLNGAMSSEVIECLEWLADVTFMVRDLDSAENYQQSLINSLTLKYGKTDYRVTDAQWSLKKPCD